MGFLTIWLEAAGTLYMLTTDLPLVQMDCVRLSGRLASPLAAQPAVRGGILSEARLCHVGERHGFSF